MGLITLEAISCIKTTIVKNYLQKAGIAITFASRLLVEKIEIINCREILEYESINITSPRDFNSLKQCMKYLIEEETAVNTYVVMGNGCNQGDEKLADFSVNIFQSSYYSDEIVLFNLCEGQGCSEKGKIAFNLACK